jgi:NAD(P)-dependent dehydrogenase (short-subunit alcohol dehydrogenase family)
MHASPQCAHPRPGRQGDAIVEVLHERGRAGDRAKVPSTISIGRFQTPEDLGKGDCFIFCDEASMITGVCMEVDGGRCI